jgi:hypothetical protein
MSKNKLRPFAALVLIDIQVRSAYTSFVKKQYLIKSKMAFGAAAAQIALEDENFYRSAGDRGKKETSFNEQRFRQFACAVVCAGAGRGAKH